MIGPDAPGGRPHRLIDAADAGGPVRPVIPLTRADLDPWLAAHPAAAAWVRGSGFAAEAGTSCLLPGPDGHPAAALHGIGGNGRGGKGYGGIGSGGNGGGGGWAGLWDWASLPDRLPPGAWRIDAVLGRAEAEAAAFGWAMGGYRFDRYRRRPQPEGRLVWPAEAGRAPVTAAIAATFLVRDLITTPASDMGPEELADAARAVARRHGARSRVIVGSELLRENYPAIHAVGRASPRLPRLIDLTWGEPDAPKVTLVGKGVCFDSGGLDLKPSAAMKLMKKDMGGAATVLGLADMVMAAGLKVRLRVLIPAVENSVSGQAMRPLDVVRSRKGTTIEIGNTDAEGRVILADALADAAAEDPSLLIDCATLTGAARAALGPELPALFTGDDGLAEALESAAAAVADPLWRLPLWQPYRRHLEGKTADLTNAPDSPFAGAILAALFLAEFVQPVRAWAHLDLMAWNTESRPGRPEGGEAMGMRALFRAIEQRFPA